LGDIGRWLLVWYKEEELVVEDGRRVEVTAGAVRKVEMAVGKCKGLVVGRCSYCDNAAQSTVAAAWCQTDKGSL
jgi:hypothetical protein